MLTSLALIIIVGLFFSGLCKKVQLPAACELLGCVFFAPIILGLSRLESALLGSVIAAVSPAVVVPRMTALIERKYGTDKGIPQLILAGASCDDVFVIVLFTSFLAMAQGSSVQVVGLLKIPVSILTGILIGLITGYLLSLLFEVAYRRGQHIRNSLKVILILGTAFLLMAVEDLALGFYSGLLAVLSMAVMLKAKSSQFVAGRLSEKLGKIWLAAEVVLFVLVGAAVDVSYSLQAGLPAIGLILLALACLVARRSCLWLSCPSSSQRHWVPLPSTGPIRLL